MVDTNAFNLSVAFVASRCDVLFETVLAVKLAVLLYETDVLQWAPACCVRADEVLRAPDAAQSRYEWSPGHKQIN